MTSQGDSGEISGSIWAERTEVNSFRLVMIHHVLLEESLGFMDDIKKRDGK